MAREAGAVHANEWPPVGVRGFWLDLRSKRDIEPAHLIQATCAGYNYYDPLLSPKVGMVSVAPGVDWFNSSPSRSWQLNLHSFRFADFWILQYRSTGDASILERLEEVALDYIARVWDPPAPPNAEFIRSDVSVASRAAVYAYLIGRHTAGEYASTSPDVLSAALSAHVAWAADEAHYNSNNHGLFNDMHLLMALANAPGETSLRKAGPAVAERLMSTYLDLQVNAEGVHLEHTPSYALLWVLLGRKVEAILAYLAPSFPALALADQRLQQSLEQVAATLWWFTKPSGELVNLGDQGRTVAPAWVLEQQGSPGVKLLAESGYAFHKDASSYLALAGAYHATKRGRTGYRAASHKQRDELHVLWSEAGRDILIDTGLRAYDFGAERRYTFSKQAHNTLSLDASDYLRDSILEYMDATEPYGSGIRVAAACLAGSGWTVMAGEDPLLARKGITHWRLAFLEPGRWLVLCDLVVLPKGHRAEWNFHLAEQWRCTGYSARQARFSSENNVLHITRYAPGEIRSAKCFLHRGDFEPMRGWRFAGDPFAISNLRFIEWLQRGHPQLRATAFSLCETEAGITGLQLKVDGKRLMAVIGLSEGSAGREATVEFEAPDALRTLAAGLP